MEIIRVENLKKFYKVHQKEPGFKGSVKSLFNRKYYDAKAVDNISFTIQEGELVGFIGPNGAGKTTTLKCLSGLLYPTSGVVSVLGFTPHQRKSAYLKQIALVMGQKNQLWWDLPAMESFLLNKEIYQVPDKKFKETLGSLVDLLEIQDVINVQVRKLSLGQRMKCELIAALIHSPRVLFLDEPTIGLDVIMQQNLREFIKGYNKKYNATILLTSHYMKDVEQLCERIIVIDHGEILYDGKLADIVKKYATEKILSITFTKKVTKESLLKFGKIQEFDPFHVKLSIERAKTSEVAAKVLDTLPVDDVNIEEPAIEDIISDVFTKEAK